MIITSDDFAVANAGTSYEMYNAHYKINEYTLSLSYGGNCYGSGFWNKNDGTSGGSFEACVWNTDTGDIILADDGEEVRGWLSIDQVHQLAQQLLDNDVCVSE